MSAWDCVVLLGAFLAILACEAVLLYASTALAGVGLRAGTFLLASSLAAAVWAAAVGGVALVVRGQPSSLGRWPMVAATVGGLALSWLAPAFAFAWVFSTSARRGLLVSTYQLALRAITCLLIAATALLLLRLFLAASALAAGV